MPREAFAYFVVQDSHYLRAYYERLSLVSARAHDEDAVRMFALHASNAIDVERECTPTCSASSTYPADVDAARSKPTTTAYMSYLHGGLRHRLVRGGRRGGPPRYLGLP